MNEIRERINKCVILFGRILIIKGFMFGMTKVKLIYLNTAFFLALPIIFLYASIQGVGVSSDSIGFLSNGKAFAPLYNNLILLISNGITDGAEKVKHLNLLLYFFSNLFLFMTIRFYSTSTLIPLIATSAFGLNKCVLDIYLFIHNEALALLLLIAFCYLMSKYIQKPTLIVLIIIAIVGGLIPPARYAFSSSILVGVLFFLFRPEVKIKKRIMETALYGTISFALSVYLLLINNRISLNNNRVAGREFAFNGNADLDRYTDGLISLSHMFFPTQLGVPITIITAFSIIAITIFLYLYGTKENDTDVSKNRKYFGLVVLVSMIAYAALLLLSVQIEANLPLYGRYMIPFVFYFSLLGGISFNREALFSGMGIKKASILTMVLLFLYFPANLLRVTKYIVETNEQGLGYNSLVWRHSPVLKSLKTISFEKDATILTNSTEILRYHSGLNVQLVPKKITRRTGKDSDQSYEERVQSIKNKITMKNGYYIHFNKIDWRFYLPPEDEVKEIYKLSPILTTSDGTIYRSKLSKGTGLVYHRR